MSGSVAEERIRAKAEAALRHSWPHARIIHELVLEWGVIRIDLAAVSPDHIALVEIKSERDVLDRLPAQLARALTITPDVLVVTNHRHAESFGRLSGSHRARHLIEREDADALEWIGGGRPAEPPNPNALFDVLWQRERVMALARFGAPVGPKTTRLATAQWAFENLTGAQIRRAVCTQLRKRTFTRADPKDPTP